MISGFYIDIYQCSITFVIDSNEEELKEFFSNNPHIPEENQKEIIELFKKKKGNAFTGPLTDVDAITVFITEPTYRNVAHEIYHLCHLIMTQRSIEDEEAWAYLIGYITEKFYNIKDGKEEE